VRTNSVDAEGGLGAFAEEDELEAADLKYEGDLCIGGLTSAFTLAIVNDGIRPI
jgi:hypothetical protein